MACRPYEGPLLRSPHIVPLSAEFAAKVQATRLMHRRVARSRGAETASLSLGVHSPDCRSCVEC